MKLTIQSHLEFLYGPQKGAETQSRLAALADRYRAQFSRSNRSSGESLAEADVLLITYADQVREPGRAPLQTLADFAAQHLRDVISGIHILPFYPWSSDDGFSVKDLFAVDAAFGTWDDIARLRSNFELMFDAVFNHLSAQGTWFQKFLSGDPRFREFFVTVEGKPELSQVVRPRALPLLTEFQTWSGPQKIWTTFSADQVDLNFKNPGVLLAVIEALLSYVAQGARFIRLDAIAYLWKEIGTPCIHLPQTHRIVQLLRALLDEVSPQVMLITETNVPHADNLSYFGDGTNEAQLVYNFALPPLVVHSLTTGNAGHLTRWAAALRLPSDCVTFFNFLASHDGIGINPVRGILRPTEIESLVQRAQTHGGFVSYKDNPDGSKSPYELNISFFDALSNPNDQAEPIATQIDRFMAAQAIMLALAGMPGVYFHSLLGSRNDRAGAEASGIPRRINRQKLSRNDLERELADSSSLRARVFSRYRQLLCVRRAQAAFHPCGAQQVLAGDDRVFALLRSAPDGTQRVLCLHNVTSRMTQFEWAPGHKSKTLWLDLLTGTRHGTKKDGSFAIELAPYQVFWARQE